MHYGGDSDEHAAAWTSTAGTVWKRVPHGNAVFGYAAINDIAVFDDGLIAVGDGSVWIASPES